jgi:hypothetical protein
LQAYCISRISQYEKEGDEKAAENLSDRFSAVAFCYERFGRECQSLEEFCSKIAALFIDEDEELAQFIILSTIHRAKGDEADVVFLLGSDYLPFRYKNQVSWQIQQEWNLVYVALTRAKKRLYFVPCPKENNDKDYDGALAAFLRHPLGGMRLPDRLPPLPLKIGDTAHYTNPDKLEKCRAFEGIDLKIVHIWRAGGDGSGDLVLCTMPDGSENTFGLRTLRAAGC